VKANNFFRAMWFGVALYIAMPFVTVACMLIAKRLTQ
jgi:hypothetical protein